jgi:hypothetical protein
MKPWAFDHKQLGRFYLIGVINVLMLDTVLAPCFIFIINMFYLVLWILW